MSHNHKNVLCLDCDYTWADGGGNTCPNCGGTDIVHTVPLT